jgi:hypothetical protein
MGSADPNLVLEETELETCILVAAPVRNAEGRVLAALAYRLEVLGTLRSLIAAANGRGGARLHAYSSSGEWVADLSLHPAARLTDSPRPLQTPVQDLLARIASGDSGIPVPSAPALMLTRSLVNVEGYRGREGQWVVGAASAAGQVGVGLVAEMDGSDAYRSVYRARWTLIGLAILLGFSLLLVILNQTSGGGVAAPAVTSSARNTAAWAILAVSIVATGITWWATKSKVDQYDRTRFEQEAAGIREDLLERVRRYAESLRSVKASFEAFGAIDAVEWSDFVGSLDLAETFPGLSYIAFVQNVEAAEMEAFQASFGAGPGVPYRPYPQVSRPLYFPIRYMAPMARNLNEVGFDVASSQALRAVLEQARDSGQITVSGIVDEALLSGGETGVLMLDPVYRPDSETQNRTNRRKAIVGWVAAFLRT